MDGCLAIVSTNREKWFPDGESLRNGPGGVRGEQGTLENQLLIFFPLLCRPEAPNEFYDGDHDNDKESDVEI